MLYTVSSTIYVVVCYGCDVDLTREVLRGLLGTHFFGVERLGFFDGRRSSVFLDLGSIKH